MRFLTLLTSSQNFSNIPILLKQLHYSGFLQIARYHSMILCTDIRSCLRGFKMIQFCLVYHQIVQSNLIKAQYIFYHVIKCSLFSRAFVIGINFINSKVPLLTRGKVVREFSTSSFRYVCMQVTKFVKRIS